MRWQNFTHGSDRHEQEPDYDAYTLAALYERQAEIEQRLDARRYREPARKRKYELEHEIWAANCERDVTELQKVRDAIIAKKQSTTEA